MVEEKAIYDVLEKLNSIAEAKWSITTGKDTTLISHKTPEGTDVDLASTMTSTLFGTCEKAAKDFNHGYIDAYSKPKAGIELLRKLTKK